MNKLPSWTPWTWSTSLFALALGIEIGARLTDAIRSGSWIGVEVSVGVLLAAVVHHLRMPWWSAPAFWTLVVGLGVLGEVCVGRLAWSLGADRGVVVVALIAAATFAGWRFGVGPAPVGQVPPGPEEAGSWLLALGATTLGVALGMPTSDAPVERAVVLGNLLGFAFAMRDRSPGARFWTAVVLTAALASGLRSAVRGVFVTLALLPVEHATLAVLAGGTLLGSLRAPHPPARAT